MLESTVLLIIGRFKKTYVSGFFFLVPHLLLMSLHCIRSHLGDLQSLFIHAERNAITCFCWLASYPATYQIFHTTHNFTKSVDSILFVFVSSLQHSIILIIALLRSYIVTKCQSFQSYRYCSKNNVVIEISLFYLTLGYLYTLLVICLSSTHPLCTLFGTFSCCTQMWGSPRMRTTKLAGSKNAGICFHTYCSSRWNPDKEIRVWKV